MQIKTSLGTFEVELYTKHCPKTCKNFLELSKKGYYNNTVVSTPQPSLVDPAAVPVQVQEVGASPFSLKFSPAEKASDVCPICPVQ